MKAGLGLAFSRQGPLLETHKLGRVKPGGKTFIGRYCNIFWRQNRLVFFSGGYDTYFGAVFQAAADQLKGPGGKP